MCLSGIILGLFFLLSSKAIESCYGSSSSKGTGFGSTNCDIVDNCMHCIVCIQTCDNCSVVFYNNILLGTGTTKRYLMLALMLE